MGKNVRVFQTAGPFAGIERTREVAGDVIVGIVTPEVAAKLLGNAAPNRKIRLASLNRIKEDLAAGRWKYDGAPIRLDEDGFLLDGQHRLTAIVETGVPAECMVVRNIPRQSMDVMDTGKSRSEGETLRIAGEKNPTALASIIKLVAIFKKARINGLSITQASDLSGSISRQQVCEILEKNPKFRDAAHVGMRMAKLTSPAGAGGAYYLFALDEGRTDDHRELADLFFDAVLSGASLPEGSPILALRQRLMAIRGRSTSLNTRYIAPFVLCAFIRAWNAEKLGEKLSRISLLQTTDPFPAIR